MRPDGRISTPLIEDITAAGKSPTHLAREIEGRLAKYIQEPNVTVIVRSFIGPPDRQVRVIGEASDPIAIPYRDHMTLLDVMIATKGLTKYAAGNRAIIVRTDSGGKQQTIKVRLNDLIKDGDINQNIEMSPGDTLIVPQILVLRATGHGHLAPSADPVPARGMASPLDGRDRRLAGLRRRLGWRLRHSQPVRIRPPACSSMRTRS